MTWGTAWWIILTNLILSTASVIVAVNNKKSRLLGLLLFFCNHVILYNDCALQTINAAILWPPLSVWKVSSYVRCKCDSTTISDIFWHLNNVGVQSPLRKHMTKQIICLFTIDTIEARMKPLSESSHAAYKERSQFSDFTSQVPTHIFIPLSQLSSDPNTEAVHFQTVYLRLAPFLITSVFI